MSVSGDTAGEPSAVALRREIIEMIGGCWTTQVVGVAARLQVPDMLAKGPRTVAEVATEAGSAAPSTKRLLRAMCSLGLARQIDEETFASTPLGDMLRSDAPSSFRGMALSWTSRLWTAWGGLEGGVRTGEPAVLSGSAGFANAAANPAIADVLNQAQADRSRIPAQETARTYDFSRFKEVADVGGGYGTVLAEILKANPKLKGAVYDLAYLEEKTLAFQAAEGVGERARFVGGDFFQHIEPGPDCFVLKSILHDWNDDDCRTILKNCAKALGPGGTIIVVEQVLPAIADDDPAHHSAFRTDLTMLLGTGGLERTEDEYRALFAECGVTLKQVASNQSEFHLIEAVVD